MESDDWLHPCVARMRYLLRSLPRLGTVEAPARLYRARGGRPVQRHRPAAGGPARSAVALEAATPHLRQLHVGSVARRDPGRVHCQGVRGDDRCPTAPVPGADETSWADALPPPAWWRLPSPDGHCATGAADRAGREAAGRASPCLAAAQRVARCVGGGPAL